MRKILLMPILALCACGPTDTPLDDIFFPPQTCANDVVVQNNSSHVLNVEIYFREVSHDNRCDPYEDNPKDTVRPGETKTVRAQMKCYTCGVTASFTVAAPDDQSVGITGHDSARVYCEDGGCRRD